MSEFFAFDYLPWYELIVRLLLAMFLGWLIGLDRHSKNKPVDIRVFIIVSMATCMISMVGQALYFEYSGAGNVIQIDLGQITAGTLTGIGFLGAGAIIKQSNSKKVIGSATGASIWASGGVGLSLGYGYYGIAIVTTLLLAGTLYILGLFLEND